MIKNILLILTFGILAVNLQAKEFFTFEELGFIGVYKNGSGFINKKSIKYSYSENSECRVIWASTQFKMMFRSAFKSKFTCDQLIKILEQ